MGKENIILVINPGSTHDEVSLFKGEEEIFHDSIKYSVAEIQPYEDKNVTSQYDFRKSRIKKALAEKGIDLNTIDAVIGRGGLLHPIPGGVLNVNEAMVDDLAEAKYGDHVSNLGAILARAVGNTFNKPAYIADSVVVDEMEPLARYSGMPENPRVSIFHCLNQKRVARLAAAKLGKDYSECSLIVMHAGGGISCGAHKNGKVIDVNNGLDGDGPFTPQRSGGVPAGGLAKLCFSGKYTKDDIKLKISRKGGLRAYLGTSDLISIDKYITGEPFTDEQLNTANVTPEKAKEILEAMSYQIAKEIGALAAVFKGKVDAIVLTGGVMYDKFVVEWIKERVEWIAPIFIFPGGDEMRALRDAANRALNGEEIPQDYEPWT
ncbi:MAG: butyrate kinase [Firmicutes bacterium]|nr:butyrate kinase [Bacillota bacterium]